MKWSPVYSADLKRENNSLQPTFMRGSRILITGGLGLIGSAIVDLILWLNKNERYGCQISIADINRARFNDLYQDVDELAFIQYDANKPINFGIDFDYIIHCAGLASPQLYVTAPVETMTTNISGVSNLLEACKNKPVKKFIYISSSEVYGQQQTADPYSEDMISSLSISVLRSSYSTAKMASEMLCKSYASEYRIPAVSVRPGHIFGPAVSPNDKRIASLCLKWAAAGQGIVLNSAGTQRRSFCYSIDCAAAIIHLLEAGSPGEAYNIGAKEATTILEMASYAAKAGGVSLTSRPPSEDEKEQANPMNNSALDSRKLIETGFSFQFGCEEAVDHCVTTLKSLG